MTQLSPSAPDRSTDRAIASLLDKLSERLHSGESVDVDVLIADHPEYADRLRDLLPALQLLADASRPDAQPIILTPLSADPEPLGDFRIIRELGRGGMAVVYEAEQLSLNRVVALKVLPFAATMDPRQLQRFRNEAQAAACLHHANIVPVHGVGSDRGVHYYAMQLIEGQTLAQVIKDLTPQPPSRSGKGEQESPPPFPLREGGPGGLGSTAPIAVLSTKRDRAHFRSIAELIACAADALEYAHSMGVVHRDIKPGNLMLDNAGHLWITDFGLAKSLSPGREAGELTLTGDLIGTLRYMSPEQALAKHGLVDHHTDIYSLGATLYELLTLQPAVQGADKEEILKHIAFEEPTPLRKFDKSIPAELETITLKCLAKEPGERYATAGEVAEDLRRWLGDRAIAAKPPGVLERSAKWVRRHQTVARMSFVMLLLIVAGLSLSTWLIWREKEAVRLAKIDVETQRDRATRARDRTFEALDTMTSGIAGTVLESQPALSAQQRQFLTNVLRYYEEFAAEQADDDQTRYRVASAAYRMGYLYNRFGNRSAANRAWEQARDALQRLVADFPDKADYRLSLAVTYGNLGLFLSDSEKNAEAEGALGKSRDLLKTLAADFPDVMKYRYKLGTNDGSLGTILGRLGRKQDAEVHFRSAITTLTKLTKEFPTEKELQHVLGMNHVNFGGFLFKFGDPSGAEVEYGEALKQLEPLVAEFPHATEFRLNLAKAFNHLAILMKSQGKRVDAKAAYEKALVHLERLEASAPGAPDYRLNLAQGYSNLGIFHKESGELNQAKDAFLSAVAHFEYLATRFSQVPEYRRDLAVIQTALGEVLVLLGIDSEAVLIFRKSILIREKLAEEFPQQPQYRSDLALNYIQLGEVLTATGKTVEAERACRMALALAEKLTSEFPTEPEYRRRLAGSHSALGALLSVTGRGPEGHIEFQFALDLREKLVAEFPTASRDLVELGGSQVNRGLALLRHGGNETEALKWHNQGIATLKPLVEAHQELPKAKQFLQKAYWGRGIALDLLQRFPEAIDAWDRAIEHSSPQDQQMLRARRANSKRAAGLLIEAVSEVGELTRRNNWTPDQWYDFACVYAVASTKIADKKHEYADRAIKLLQKAANSGYKDAAHMKKDLDLDALRDREDFKNLIAKLESRPK